MSRRCAALLVGLLLSGCGAAPVGPAPEDGTRTGRCRAATVVCEQLDAFRFVTHGSFGLDRVTSVPSGDARVGRALRVDYPAGSVSPASTRRSGTPEGGAQVYLLPRRPLPHDRAYLRYWVRFPSGFAFVKGGKLPGLYGGTVTSGKRIPDGTNGWSTRFMWRTGGAAEVYAYLPSSVAHGTSLGRGSWVWPTGSWHEVEQEVALNDPGRADGSLTVWLDGAQVLHASALAFRTTGSLGVDGLFFSTFFGGDDPSWASPTDQHVDLAGFTVAGSRAEAS